ncbi:MAG: YdiK family protein [Bacillus sp. (in: firmicutes)]
MKRQSPLVSGLINISLGALFTFLAIYYVTEDGGWNAWSILCVILATFDIGNGIRMLGFHSRLKRMQKK